METEAASSRPEPAEMSCLATSYKRGKSAEAGPTSEPYHNCQVDEDDVASVPWEPCKMQAVTSLHVER